MKERYFTVEDVVLGMVGAVIALGVLFWFIS